MTYRKRLTTFILLDSMIVMTAIFLSYLTLEAYLPSYELPALLTSSLALLLSHHFFAYAYKLYNKAWQYASVGELVVIVKVVTFSILTTLVVQLVAFQNGYIRALLLTWMLHVLFIGGSRFSRRIIQDRQNRRQKAFKRTLIVGAGAAGTMVARQLIHNQDIDLKPVAFVDDDTTKIKLDILGIPVIGTTSQIATIVKKYAIETIVIAIPSLSNKQVKHIVDECVKTTAKTQFIPKLEDLMTGKVSVKQMREVEVEDLLGRDPIELDIAMISENLNGKTVLVTGAGGSIGSEICRQVCRFNPLKIVLVGHGENSIYQIDMELRNRYQQEIEIVPVIGDVQSRERIFTIIQEHQPNIVYHAAAHKHVPLMEVNPREAVKNNIFGTKNVAEAAQANNVDTFVMISTDKAVNPTNVMGATKRFAEMVIQQLAESKQGTTKFVAVRFGNVLGSRGSVIPLFKKQIEAGGPVTVTHPDMTRYFMTIPEASKLVIQAGVLARGGEIFVLDMGEPVKIVDLAKNLIKLSGYHIDEIGIHYSGIRPGEKMYEELLNENEVNPKQIFPKIHMGKAVMIDSWLLTELVDKLLTIPEADMCETLIKVANNQFELQI
ncbi:polysaccharide biosynthesis protein [Bacillus sp. DNRA2]|uniref:polysaccharide biosynthesis protein n=1 Tax=Bacillus sp. DNRA2 TaxID=2723053 RepID=UPI00145EFF52|nr:nucleoside-diphosphate sugar epimerase/dehydratase [Bacillus sp. DNRA2]NMD70158.1 polysaccharide biosynthesis protein [Bacillus sp. DNRA2]